MKPVLADDRLVEQVRHGDDEAFGELVRRYQEALCHFLFCLTGGREEAEDLAQETFVKAYLALPSLHDAARFRPWLYRIAGRLARSWQRRRPPVNSLEDEAILRLVEQSDAVPSPEADCLAQEQREAVWEAVQALPNLYRLPVVLRYYQDFSYAEIAATLGVPDTTVDTRLRKAKSMLRGKLVSWVLEER